MKKVDVLDLIPPDEGEINQYYGRIGCGKTYAATVDILRELTRGQVVYANWIIDWSGYDQRQILFYRLLGILGLKRHFLYFPKENLRYFEVKNTFTDDISQLTDCKIYLDEGHIAFDSYEMARMKMEKREAVLHTRHFNRTIVIISQRPSAIHVTLRANVNRFFKCEKVLDWKFFGIHLIRFKKTEFQDTDDNDKPKEDKIKEFIKDEKTGMMMAKDTSEYEYAISTQYYWGRSKIFKAYDTKYMRKGMKSSQTNLAELWRLWFKDHFKKNAK